MPSIPVTPLAAAVLDRLEVAAGLNVFAAGKVDAPVDSNAQAYPFAVLYPAPGSPAVPSLSGPTDSLDWRFQITCGGGDVTRALKAVDAARAALTDWEPGVIPTAGASVGRVQELDDYQPGPPAQEGAEPRSRWSTALLFTAPVTILEGGQT